MAYKPVSSAFFGCFAPLAVLFVFGLVMFMLFKKPDNVTAPTPDTPAPVPANTLRLLFTYSSEKKEWLSEVNQAFNAAHVKLADGMEIQVEAIPMGSGDCVAEILAGTRQPDLISPASGAFITLGNAQSRTAMGSDVVAKTENLVLSPVVVAMWKPMAEALGWPGTQISWSQMMDLAVADSGWGSIEQPAWGSFHYGHTHPEYSNSGLAAVMAEIYAGAGKTQGLSLEDLAKPAVTTLLTNIETSVVHYGSSTGFFADSLQAGGPSYLSAAVLYENNVVEINQALKPKGGVPLIAVYPKEGSFWADHPTGIVERPWVTPQRRAAAALYIKFLLDKPQQEAALRRGFRPANTDVALGAPILAANGVDSGQPQTVLEVPSAEVLNGCLALWQRCKKPAHVVLVLDSSGSMNDEGKISAAATAASSFVSMLADRDELSVLTFSTTQRWAATAAPIASQRKQLSSGLSLLTAQGGTALYDAILSAQAMLAKHPDPTRINAIVVLSDGDDTDSKASLAQLLQTIQVNGEHAGVRIFTIAYGKGANTKILKQISAATQGKTYVDKPESILQTFRDISTFF